jgi:4-amino-4-deoxy-L-arabinose transferase-like glycosyltransferase
VPPAERDEVRQSWLILVVFWVLFYCSFTLFTPPLLDDADSVHAEVAREMLTRHDFVTLYANGIRYLEKAPLFYWLEAGSMRLLGATTAASRLPLAFSVLALVLLLEVFGRRAFGSVRAGLYAGLITLSSFGIFIFSRINIPDVLVCVLLVASVYVFWKTEAQDKPSLLLCCAFGAALALNILTKGLIGIVFPVGIVLVYLLLTRGFRGAIVRIGQMHPLAALAVFLVIAVPWHVLVARANPGHGTPGDLSRIGGHWQVPLPTDGNVHGWTWFYFMNEQVYRYLNVRVPHDYDTAPLWLFYGLILIWLMPWAAFLAPAVLRALPPWKRLRTLKEGERTNLLLLLWAVLPLLFFSLSTRQEYYVLPSLPPMILLIARLLASGSREGVAPSPKAEFIVQRISGLLLVAGIVLSVVTLVFLLKTKAPAPTTDLASLLQANPGDYALSFGHFLDLNARALGLFRMPLALTAVALVAGPLANWLLRRRGKLHEGVLALAGAAFLFLFAAHWGLRIFSPTLTSAALADAIRPRLHAGDLVAIHGEYEAGSTLGFYLRRNDLHIVEGRSSNLWYGSFFPDAPGIFESRESITAKWAGGQRIFLWEDPQDRDRPPLVLPGVVYVVAKAGGKVVLSNRGD